jgi:hypothetical protein
MKLACVLAIVGCGGPGDGVTPDGPPGTGGDAQHDGSVDAPAAEFAWPTCGTGTFDQTQLFYGNAIAVAHDGTVFHHISDGGESYISRYRPGQTGEPNWADLGVAATGVTYMTTDASGALYALVSANGQTQLERVNGGTSVTPIGAAVSSTGGPTSIAFAPDGVLFEAGFQGLARVDLATGHVTAISPPVQLRELYFVGGRTARGVSYDHGLVELTVNAAATSATLMTIFPFDTIALQWSGLDQTGRTYALIHEMSYDKLVRFDAMFATRETLYMYPTSSIMLGGFAFGRGALRCDVLVTGFSIGHVASGDTPALP